jgi:predicted AlkP superfamily phosphohydrolase/phosphomutase
MMLSIACLAILPLVVWLEHSAFIDSPIEYLEVVAGLTVAFAVVAGLASIVLRAAGADAETRGGCARSLGLAAVAGLLGFIPGGALGVALGASPFFLLAIFEFRGSAPDRSAFGATGLSIALVSILAFSLRAPHPDNQVVFFGLDGATWPIMDELIEADRIPAIQGLIETGARANLDVIDPVISPPLWTSIATGRMPEVHGIKDFWASSKQVQSKRIWDIADEHGLISGVFGYLVTWPPEKTNGFLVPGWLAQDASTYPESLSFVKEIEIGGKADASFGVTELLRVAIASIRHGVTVGTANTMVYYFASRKLGWDDGVALARDGRLLKVDLTADVFCHLLKRTQPDFALFYTSGIDAIEHLFFKYFRPDGFPTVTEEDVRNYGDAIPQAYEAADRAVGAIVDVASPDANYILVSDHGQTSAASQGDLWYVIKTTALIELLDIPDDVRPTNIASTIYLRKDGEIPDPWPVRTGLEGVVALPNRVPLFEIKQNSPGEIRIVVRKDFSAKEGDLVLVGGKEVPYERILEPADRVSGVHTRDAVFLMNGPAVVEGVELDRGSVLDVAPTTLALLEIPLALDLEGVVIQQAFREELPVTFIDTYGAPDRSDDAESASRLNPTVVDRLKTLGYVE